MSAIIDKHISFSEVELASSKVVQETEDKLEENSENSENHLYNGSQGSLTEVDDNNLPLNINSSCSAVLVEKVWLVLLILLPIY